MPVLTKKEYLRLSKLRMKEEQTSEDDGSSEVEKKEVPKKVPQDKYEYYLLHPENGVDHLQNFQDTLNIEGKDYERNCENGVVRTTEKVLADKLVSKQYILMEKIKLDGTTDRNRN